MAFGLLSFGAYLPRLRLDRAAMGQANAWFSPGLAAQKGERAMAGWDEDPITMGVEAARDCLEGFDRTGLAAIQLASTTHPYDDRQNSAVAAAALNLPAAVASSDLTGSLRAGTSGLISALASPGRTTLLIAADKRKAKPASGQEFAYGDGAAAFLVGEGEPVATLLGARSETVDFVDHYRAGDRSFDYGWEERWIRDDGYLKIVPRVVQALLSQAGVAPEAVDHFCMPAILPRVAAGVAKACGLKPEALRDSLASRCGDTGAAHALVLLAHALEQAEPGQRILAVGFGQGCDAMLFEVLPAIRDLPRRIGVEGSLRRRRPETSYAKFLAFNDLIPLERGMRAELDKATALTALYRNRDTVTSLIGGRCTVCGTLQFPKSRICVGPNCHAVNTQEDHPFSEMIGNVMSYTADMLTYSPEPPQHFGMIQFPEGGRIMMDFTDVDVGGVDVGMPMRMVFRIKDVDGQRGFTRYFWKATPVTAAS
jgi:3-hydroxy-3-methylglutaryl CoA synthase